MLSRLLRAACLANDLDRRLQVAISSLGAIPPILRPRPMRLLPDALLWLIADAARAYTEDLPVITLFFRALPYVHVSSLWGIAQVPPETNIAWNMYQWEFD